MDRTRWPLVLSLVAACETVIDDESEPVPSTADDAAAETAEVLVMELEVLAGIDGIARGSSELPATRDERDEGVRGTRHLRYAVECTDAAGALIECGEGAAVASAGYESLRWSAGELLTVEESLQGEWRLEGLVEPTTAVTWSTTWTDSTAVFSLEGERLDADDVTVEATMQPAVWSPSIGRLVSGARRHVVRAVDDDGTTTVHEVVAQFDGSKVVTLAVEGAGAYVLDLVSETVRARE